MPASAFPARGLYAITRSGYPQPSALADAVAAAIRGGAAVVQYRAKSAADPRAEASALLAVCRSAGVPLLMNDDVDLALAIGADGVHLGKDDATPEEARSKLGPAAIIGVSCYDSVESAVALAERGVDYVAFGRFFPSRTKPGAHLAHPETLGQAKRRLRLPIVAIGGITPDNGGSLLLAGADLLAVIEGVFGEGDPEPAARRYAGLFSVR